MYFTSEEHNSNLNTLLSQFNRTFGKDPQYDANYYIAAVPEIFNCFPDDLSEVGDNPLFYLMSYDEENDVLIPATAGLTGSTNRMVEFGMSLFNGHLVSLDDVLGSVASEHLIKTLVQAFYIRANKYS
ncbi:hypothetical protein H0266_18385 [Halobacillus locisalis]|uniref:Uncharacterized protein n=1 Tax=Halobacillus locisalis TaxID=220753 RepID=A0A838CY41_9BACI|nr:hypothetical protein [Halobacillus locisalis]MBA2176851.1 hypothetical protein [Halobacillus locisalis]